MKIKLRLVLFFTLLFFLSGISIGFSAETEEEEGFMLEEVTVTAQKREENQQKVAIAMDVLSGEDIKELGKSNLDQILSNVSSAIIQKAADGLRVSIRGISDDSSASMGQSMASPSVAINTDGVYSNRKDTGSSLFDVERVEVLYGPQSTMYASNSPGGIVNVVTASPKLDKFEMTGSLEAGSYNLISGQASVNAPVAEKVALRGSVSITKRDGYLTRGGDNEDTKSGRVRALYQPNDNLSFTTTGEISKNTGAGFGGGVVMFADQDDVDDPWTAAENESVGDNDQTTKKIFMNINWDTKIGAITVVPSYSKRDGTNEMAMMGSTWHGTQDVEEKSAELRIASPADFFFKWLIGANYYKTTDAQYMVSDEFLVSGFNGNGTMSDRKNTEDAKALYGNITYPVMDALRLTGGIRASWDQMVTDNYEWKPEGGQMQLKDEEPTQNTNDARPDYKLGLEYDLAENTMLYGDYATSYRVQGMSQATDPQELKAYSVGSKSRFLDNKLQVNAAAYYYDYKNYNPNYRKQVWVQDLDGDNEQDGGGGGPPPGAGGSTESETEVDSGAEGVTGDGKMLGADLNVSAVLSALDMVNLSVAYIHSEWTDLYFDWVNTTHTVLVEGKATVVPLPDDNYNGKPMTNTPEWTINLSYNHNFNLWNGGLLKAGVTSKYQSGYRMSWPEEDYPNNYQEGHHIEGATLAYNHPGGAWSLSAYANNIFNYAEKRTYMNAGGMGMLSIGDPLTYGCVLAVRY